MTKSLLLLVPILLAAAPFLVAGFGGNRWYLARARRAIEEIRSQGLPQEAYLKELSRRGGTNNWAWFLILGFSIVAWLALESILGRSPLGAILCEGLAVIAAFAAFVLGILGLVINPRGGGRVKERWPALTGLVTATLTVLSLVPIHGVVMPALVPKIESSNHLKELGLAMEAYHDLYGGFPPAVIHDRALGDRAKPYSWRVAVLPILGEEQLFHQYRRDEPWDSPANKAVLARMPRAFAAPGSASAADGLTDYQVLVGPGTPFERPKMLRLADLPRGASETILVVEATDPVPWTKPQDLAYAPDGPLPKVGGVVGNGFHAMFADGSVRWIEAKEQESAFPRPY